MKEKFNGLKAKVVKALPAGVVGAVAACAPVFAEEGSSLYYTVTTAQIQPITTAISSSLTTLIPIGIGVMGTMVGVSLIPRIIYKFL